MIAVIVATVLALFSSAASGDLQPAERGEAKVVNPSPAPPPAPIAPVIVPGDCESVRAVFDWFDPSGASSAFFVDQGVAWRESRCGLDTINERTGDTGVVQINPTHNRAGYFGGTYFGDGGWLFALHGLTTRHDTLNIEWANAAITLRQVCGNGPWHVGNFSCLWRTLATQ